MTCTGRMYDSEHQAHEALGALQAEGFTSGSMMVITPESVGHPVTAKAVISAASSLGTLPRVSAVTFARGLQQGKSVALIDPPYATGALAESIMDGCHPADRGGPPVVENRNPSPFSDIFDIPTLSTRGRSVFSIMFPELTRHDFRLFGGKLSNKAAPFSSMLGLKTISTKPMKNSSFGLPLLKKRKSPWTRSFGLPLLTRRSR